MQLEDQAATGEVDQVIDATPEVIEPPISMDDTIRNTLRGLQDKGVTTDEPTESPASPEEKAQRIRDTQGKFAAKEAPAPVDMPVVPAEPVEAVSTAPNTWKKESHDAWSKADPVLRAEVERREADFHKGIEQYRAAATYAQTMERAISPHMQTLQSLGITPDKAVAELMQADHKLRFGQPHEKQQYFAQLAQNYGIDLGQVQAMPAIDPNMSAMQQRIQQLEGSLQQQSLMGQQQQEAALNSEIATFAADPSHSHFESVKGHMSALLQAGQAKDLADAYEQAIYANPTTRGAVLQQQATAQREEAAKKAQAARTAASVNVRSRPSMPVSQPIGSMDDTIRNAYRRMTGA